MSSISPIKNSAGWCMASIIWGTFFQVAAPIASGYNEAEAIPLNCPQIVVTHGVGSDLRTFTNAVDRCSEIVRVFPTEITQ